jgi:hypothetical protein
MVCGDLAAPSKHQAQESITCLVQRSRGLGRAVNITVLPLRSLNLQAHTRRRLAPPVLPQRRSQLSQLEQFVSKGDAVNRILNMLVVGTMLAAGSGAVAFAADASDPAVGTWVLNLEKSKFTPGPAPKSQTRTYAQTADGMSMTITGVAPDGSATSVHSTFKYDGKDYPITGSPDYDTLALKRVNGSTIKSVQKKNGKVVGSATRSISAHGKVMTLAIKGKDAKGASFHNVYVYDKQ